MNYLKKTQAHPWLLSTIFTIAMYIVLQSIIPSPAQSRLKEGHDGALQMITTARSGLRLRSDNSLKSKVIMTIPNNSRVYLLMVLKEKVKIAGKSGHWANVRDNKSGKEGWVFSGFLKKVPGVSTIEGDHNVVNAGPFLAGEKIKVMLTKGRCMEMGTTEDKVWITYVIPVIDEINLTLDRGSQGKILNSKKCPEHCYYLTIKVKSVTYQQGKDKNKNNITGTILSVEKRNKPEDCY